jgi:diguanylate cyclase (GGDEF)-like protein/PAS domain S-box-containing protein
LSAPQSTLLNLQSVPCGIFLLDQNLALLDANTTLCELLGLARDDVLGRPLDDFLVPSFRLLFHMQALATLHVNGRVEEIFLNLAGSQGREIPVLFNAVRLRNNGMTVIECAVMRVNERKRLEDDLFNIKKAVEQVPGMVYQYLRRPDGSTCFPYVSEGVREICGLRPIQLAHSAQPFRERIHPDDLQAFLQSINASALTLTTWHQEFRITLKDKGVRWLAGLASPEARSNGDVIWHGHIHDITERKKLHAALANEHERTLVSLRSIGDAVITTNADAQIELLNPAAELLTGWTQIEAESEDIARVLQVVDEQTRLPAESAVHRCLNERVNVDLSSKSLLLAREGKEYAVQGTAAPILDASGAISGAVMVLRNVTTQRRQRRAVEHRAAHDHLTGLPNRAEFDRILKQLFESAQTYGAVHALCCIDLDRFKQVNDRGGHAAGDALLRRLAEVLQSCVRTKDTVARLGGDEFALLLENCDLEAAQRVAELVCTKVSALNFEFQGEAFHIGASVGVACIESRWRSAQGVQLAADQACYDAKAAGRGCVKVAGP